MVQQTTLLGLLTLSVVVCLGWGNLEEDRSKKIRMAYNSFNAPLTVNSYSGYSCSSSYNTGQIQQDMCQNVYFPNIYGYYTTMGMNAVCTDYGVYDAFVYYSGSGNGLGGGCGTQVAHKSGASGSCETFTVFNYYTYQYETYSFQIICPVSSYPTYDPTYAPTPGPTISLSPTFSPTTATPTLEPTSGAGTDGVATGVIAGAAVGGFAGFVMLIGLAAFIYWKFCAATIYATQVPQTDLEMIKANHFAKVEEPNGETAITAVVAQEATDLKV
jgi:hypothetical protein